MKEDLSDKSLRGVIVILIIFIIWVIVSNSRNTYQIKKENQKAVDSLITKYDSLREENFIIETEVNRYRIALEMLESEDYKCASEFNKRLSMTE